jgi:hypothetical protein
LNLSNENQTQISFQRNVLITGRLSKILRNEIKIKNRMKIINEKNKIKFSFKEILIIIVIALAVLALSYDGDTNDADNDRFGFPIDTLKN